MCMCLCAFFSRLDFRRSSESWSFKVTQVGNAGERDSNHLSAAIMFSFSTCSSLPQILYLQMFPTLADARE